MGTYSSSSWTKNLRLRAYRCCGFLRVRRHRGRDQRLPVATLFQTTAHDADLGFLFHNERRAALRARLVQRHVRRGEIAIRITRAAVENAWTSASALAGAP